MADIPSVLKATVDDPKRLVVAAVSAVTALAAVFGVEIEPRELVRPVLASAGFYEISATHEDAGAMVQRIQELAKKSPEHPLIGQLRTLSKEGRIPFEGREREVRLRLSPVSLSGGASVVCRSSDLRDTYVQFNSPRVGLVTFKLEGGEPCNHAAPDEVQVGQETWDKLELRATTSDVKLTMNVLLYPPVVELADRGASSSAHRAADTQLAATAPGN
jgi:hypothetical protein